ncbi:MAG: hypothetical protein Q9191_005094 [Dirinaria sp. TL-2023a]
MSGLSPIGDTIALTTLAYKLYQKGYLVARDAPRHVRDLVQEVETIKTILYTITDQVKQEPSPAITRVLGNCFETLSEFGALIEKYEILSFSDRGNRFKKVQWANEQNKIRDLREKFRDHERRLHLILTAEGRSELDKSASSKDASSVQQDLFPNTSLSMARTPTTGTTDTERTLRESSRSPRASIASLRSAQMHRDLSDRTRAYSRSGRVLKDLWKSDLRNLSVSQTLAECPNCATRADVTQAIELDDEENDTAVAPSEARAKEPFQPHSAREKYQISAALQACFEKSHDSLKTEFSLESWLRIGTWWLIKSRIISRALTQKGVQRRSTRTSEFESRWESTVSEEQASLDLLKSSWIFEEIILKQLEDESFFDIYIQKLATDLMRNIDVDLRDNRASVTAVSAADDDGLRRLNTGLLEDFQQPLEAKSDVPKAIDDPSTPFRWIDVRFPPICHSFETEKVVFRTFVNAQFGIKEHRSKSFSAPYLLLLWTAAGENNIFLSLINHQGTLNLSRKLSVHDLKHYDSADASLAPLAVDFPSHIDAEIKFLNANDVDDFLALPRRFFAAMGEQLAGPEEIALFQTHVLSYDDKLSRSGEWKTSATMRASKRSSCGLRMYETVTGDRWTVTRRLVVSSAPDSTGPFCISHWLPPDKIEIQVDSTAVTVDWSNCAQHKPETTNKTTFHYYGYDADHPNCQVRMIFGNSRDARLFRDILLYPTEMLPQVRQVVEIEPPSSVQNTRIYRLEDEHEPDTPYSAIVSATKNPKSFHKSEIFYVYKDIDFEFADKDLNAVIFHQVWSPGYVSTKPRSSYPLNEKDPMPKFGGAVMPKEGKDARFTFGCEHDLIRFMKSLTGWRLKYYGPLLKTTLIKTGGFRERKEDLKDVCVQLWEKASAEGTPRTQLVIRVSENAAEPWITATCTFSFSSIYLFQILIVRGPVLDHSYYRDRTIPTTTETSVELKSLDVQRGSVVDENMMAMTPGVNEAAGGKRWKLLLKFQDLEGEIDSDSLKVRIDHRGFTKTFALDRRAFSEESGLD